jgi:hypothetical protein
MLGGMADYVTLEHRPLLMVGTWNASTGTEAITEKDLQDIVAASTSGVLDDPIIKLGHTDPRFESRLEDGSPAYGRITNLSIEGGVLYGDYIHVPAELADSLDSAYPHSSVELARGVVLRDQEGNVVHEFACVLTANALLGATAPAVKGLTTKLSSVVAASAEAPRFMEIRVAQFSLPGGTTARDLADRLSAAIDQKHSSDAVWAYLEDFTDEKVIFGVSSYGDSTYYEQAYTVPEGSSVPELAGEPVQVVKETKWVTEQKAEPAAATQVAASEQAEESPAAPPAKEKADDTGTVHPQDTPLAEPETEEQPNTSPEPQGETTMPTVDKDKAKELRTLYGLPENASYEDLLAKVLENNPNPEVPSTPQGSDELPNESIKDAQKEEDKLDPRFSEDKDGKVTIPAELPKPKDDELRNAQVSPSMLSEVTNRLSAAEARLAAREAAETSTRRDNFVREWYRAGLIHDDECERVRARLDRDEDLTRELITDREPMFATNAFGHSDPSIFAHGEKTELETQFANDDAAFGA